MLTGAHRDKALSDYRFEGLSERKYPADTDTLPHNSIPPLDPDSYLSGTRTLHDFFHEIGGMREIGGRGITRKRRPTIWLSMSRLADPELPPWPKHSPPLNMTVCSHVSFVTNFPSII